MSTGIIYYRYGYIAPKALCCSSVAALLQLCCKRTRSPLVCFTRIPLHRYDCIAPKVLASHTGMIWRTPPGVLYLHIYYYIRYYIYYYTIIYYYSVANAARSKYLHIYYCTIFSTIFTTTRIFTAILWRTPPGLHLLLLCLQLYLLEYLHIYYYTIFTTVFTTTRIFTTILWRTPLGLHPSKIQEHLACIDAVSQVYLLQLCCSSVGCIDALIEEHLSSLPSVAALLQLCCSSVAALLQLCCMH
jgi:hypothetical protein